MVQVSWVITRAYTVKIVVIAFGVRTSLSQKGCMASVVISGRTM